MNYIVFDLEFNQDFSARKDVVNKENPYTFEIIQIGAVKLDENFHTIDTFNRLIKPTIYEEMNPFVSYLTGITIEQLAQEESFSEVYKAYIEFIGSRKAICCIWGTSDMKVLFKNILYHKLDLAPFPRMFINIQPYTSIYLGLPSKKLLRLQDAVNMLQIPTSTAFHLALSDAYYTAEIFKKVYQPSITPNCYDPYEASKLSRPAKKHIDFDALIKQFAKMYHRPMTEEEQAIIKVAYQMGKTGQFLID